MRIILLGILFNCFSAFSQKPDRFVNDSLVKKDSSVVSQDSLPVYYTDPSFPGGMKEFYNFINTNVVYPKSFFDQGLNGRISVSITIESDGKITNIKILRGMAECPECDKEVIRLLELMPNWIPATENGKPVKTFYSIPFTFKIH